MLSRHYNEQQIGNNDTVNSPIPPPTPSILLIVLPYETLCVCLLPSSILCVYPEIKTTRQRLVRRLVCWQVAAVRSYCTEIHTLMCIITGSVLVINGVIVPQACSMGQLLFSVMVVVQNHS